MPRAPAVAAVAAAARGSAAPRASYWLPPAAAQPLVVSELGWGVPPNITENTLAAFHEGLALGAGGVEATSRRTADGRVAMLRDVVATNGRVVPWTNFSDLPAGTLELSQYLQAVRPHGMNIMMQNNKVEPGYDPENRVADLIVRAVTDAGLQDKVLLSAFDIGTVARAREVCGGCGIRTAWLAVSWRTQRAMGIPPALAPALNSTQYLDKVGQAGLDAFNPEATIVDRELIEESRRRGVQVFVWWLGINTTSVESPPDMQRMADCGVTGFITPRVAMGVDARRRKAPRAGAACDTPPADGRA